MGILAALVGSVGAGEEIKVRGVTAYVIYKAPINKLDNPSIDYLDLNMYWSPSCYQIEEDENTIQKLRERKIERDQENCKELDGGGTCGYPALDCNHDGINLLYDGYWLIGREKITSNGELKNLSEIKGSVWDSVSRINELIHNVSTYYNTSNLWIVGQSLPTEYVLTFIHFNEVIPSKLSEKEYISKVYNYSEVELEESYKEQICKFLGELNQSGRSSCDSRFISLERPLPDKDRYFYRIRIAEDDSRFEPRSYRKVIFIHTDDALPYLYEDFLSPISYLIYGRKFFEEYSLNVSRKSMSLEDDLSTLRADLLNDTQVNFSYTTRLENLKLIKPRLASKESEIRAVDSSLGKVKKWYAEVDGRLNPPTPHSHESELLLFKRETNAHLTKLSGDISEIERNLDRLYKQRDNLWQMYYGELGVAVDERAIYESQEISQKAIDAADINTRRSNDLAIFIAAAVAIFGAGISFCLVNREIKSSEQQSKSQNKKLIGCLDKLPKQEKISEMAKSVELKLESNINSLRENQEETNKLLGDQPKVIREQNGKIADLLSNILESTKDKPKIDIDPLLKSQKETNKLLEDILKATKETPKKEPPKPQKGSESS